MRCVYVLCLSVLVSYLKRPSLLVNHCPEYLLQLRIIGNFFCRDTLIVSLGNCITSIVAGFPIFSILGFMAHQLGKKVPDVVTSGMKELYSRQTSAQKHGCGYNQKCEQGCCKKLARPSTSTQITILKYFIVFPDIVVIFCHYRICPGIYSLPRSGVKDASSTVLVHHILLHAAHTRT